MVNERDGESTKNSKKINRQKNGAILYYYSAHDRAVAIRLMLLLQHSVTQRWPKVRFFVFGQLQFGTPSNLKQRKRHVPFDNDNRDVRRELYENPAAVAL